MKKHLWFLIIILLGCAPSPAERNNVANNLLSQNNPREALRAYQSALITEPNNALIYFNTALAYEELGEFNLAIDALLQAIQRGDTALQADAYFNLGNLYANQSQYEQAINAYQQAILLSPSNNARYNLEIALRNRYKPTPTPLELQTQPEEAQADASATPTPNPDNALPPTATMPPELPGSDPTEERVGTRGEERESIPTTPRPSVQGTFTVQEAERLLEEAEPVRDDLTGKFKESTPMPITPVSGKDW